MVFVKIFLVRKMIIVFIMFNVFNLDMSCNGITYWNSYQGVRSHLFTSCISAPLWPGYKGSSERWETITDHDIPASSRTGND